jgi:hypothetical protein
VLYLLPEVLEAVAHGERVFVCEGEKDVEAVRAAGGVATCNPGGARKWRKEYTESLVGATVTVVADDDEPGRYHATQVLAALQARGVAARVVLPASGKDAADHLSTGCGLDEFVPLEDVVESPEDPTRAEKTVHVDPVDGVQLLGDLAAVVRRYLVLDEHDAVALGLWVVHTHAIDAVDITPYIAITSAEKRSGKTKLLELLRHLTRRPWFTGRATASVLVRKIDAEHPTLLFDEGDATFARGNELGETLRGIFNSGFRRDGTTSMSVPAGPNGWRPQDFSTFGPKAIAGIGLLPETVMDRAIRIELRRKLPDEQVERLRARYIDDVCRPLRDAAAAWAAQNLEALTGAEPALPEEIDDRAQDIWEPLLAIAELVGGEWPQLAREAAIELSRVREDDELSIGVRLLRDFRRVFAANDPADKLPSSTVIQELAQFDDAPWGNWYGRTINAQAISKILKPFGIKTQEIWFDGEKHRGWTAAKFADAWARYLSDSAVGPVGAVGAEAGGDPPTGPTAPTALPGNAHAHLSDEDVSWTVLQLFPTDEASLPPMHTQRRLLREYQANGGEIPRRPEEST